LGLRGVGGIVEDFRPDHETTPLPGKSGHVISGSIHGGREANLAARRYDKAVDGRSPMPLHSYGRKGGTPRIVEPDGVGCRVGDFLRDATGLKEGIGWDEFVSTYGLPPERRLFQEREPLRRRIPALRGYQNGTHQP
jgi:hypothetical protein